MVGGSKEKLSKHNYIIVSGIDGSGKTAIIRSLQRRLEAQGISTFCTWMRYNHVIVRPVHGLCRLVGLSRKRQTSSEKVWSHEFYRCQSFCSLYIFLTWLDTWLGKCKLVWQLRWRQVDVVICDRWTNDILIDLAVDSRRANLLDGKWFQRFMKMLPVRSKQYVIIRNTNDVLDCRSESGDDPGFSFRQRMYYLLSRVTDKVTVVNNNGTLTDAVDCILNDFNIQ